MSKKSKISISIILVFIASVALLLSVISVFLAKDKGGNDDNMPLRYKGVADLDIPDSLIDSGLGLYWFFDSDYYKSDSTYAKTAFNKQKNTLIYVKDPVETAEDEKFLYANEWENAAYNVGVFCLVNDLNINITDIFLAYYLDFMYEINDYKGSEIRFLANAEGCELILKIINSLNGLLLSGSIDKSFFPDRIALLEPEFTEKEINTQAVKTVKSLGIAVEIMQKTSKVSDYDIYSYANTLECDDSTNPFEWYSLSLSRPIPIDYAMASNETYAFSAKTPLSFTLARQGTNFIIEEGVIRSTNIMSAFIAGFAFYDSDGNGVYNERLVSRMDGAKIELYLHSGAEDRLIDSCFTGSDGFYKLSVPAIYANSFDTLYIKAYPQRGYSLTKRASYYMMANDINPNNKSELITLQHKKAVAIVNIGLK